ncbi:MAG: glucosamine-6-phosphate isomerase [Actinobacteria bacterium]|nr:glucosamine-6-phosphate isomerase [Actinomycetota bacterium]
MRNKSSIAQNWWDYTTLDKKILNAAKNLDEKDIIALSRTGFTVKFYETLESFYLAEALEYIWCWKQATKSNPTGICGPIGPTEHLPLVAQLVNELEIDLKYAHFWAMDEWYMHGKEVPTANPLSFKKANMELCFNKIKRELMMPEDNLHFLKADNIKEYSNSFNEVKCLIMQGGQGEVKHWAFNDPTKREGNYLYNPPTPEEYRKLSVRLVDLHPLTIIQNARTSSGGNISNIPLQALTVGPLETWKSKKVSIWHAGNHDNPFGLRLTTYMISKKITDSSVPMSLLGDHPDVQFNFYRYGIGLADVEMH